MDTWDKTTHSLRRNTNIFQTFNLSSTALKICHLSKYFKFINYSTILLSLQTFTIYNCFKTIYPSFSYYNAICGLFIHQQSFQDHSTISQRLFKQAFPSGGFTSIHKQESLAQYSIFIYDNFKTITVYTFCTYHSHYL